MLIQRLALAVAACSLLITANIYAETGQKIKKCQDASGRWHYGDTAAESCNQSKVTVINDKGVRVKEIAAPPTEAEINARERNKASVDNERKRAEEQGKKDEQLLATYDNEDQIIAARDRKLADLESQIRATSDTLNTLRATLNRMQAQAKSGGKPSQEAGGNIAKTEYQIARHEAALVETKKQQETVKSRYQVEFDRYRAIKNPPPKAN
jgi:chromosome segregation ATPase